MTDYDIEYTDGTAAPWIMRPRDTSTILGWLAVPGVTHIEIHRDDQNPVIYRKLPKPKRYKVEVGVPIEGDRVMTSAGAVCTYSGPYASQPHVIIIEEL